MPVGGCFDLLLNIGEKSIEVRTYPSWPGDRTVDWIRVRGKGGEMH